MNQQYQILQLKKKVEQNESEVHEKLSGLESQILALTQQQNKHKVFHNFNNLIWFPCIGCDKQMGKGD